MPFKIDEKDLIVEDDEPASWGDWRDTRPVKSSITSMLGSAEVVVQKSLGIDSARRLPEWSDEGTDSSLRDVVQEVEATPIYIPIVPADLPPDILGTPSFMTPATATPATTTPARGATPVQSGVGARSNFTDLDKFYADAEDSDNEGYAGYDDDDDEEEEEEEEEEESEEEDDGPEPGGNPKGMRDVVHEPDEREDVPLTSDEERARFLGE